MVHCAPGNHPLVPSVIVTWPPVSLLPELNVHAGDGAPVPTLLVALARVPSPPVLLPVIICPFIVSDELTINIPDNVSEPVASILPFISVSPLTSNCSLANSDVKSHVGVVVAIATQPVVHNSSRLNIEAAGQCRLNYL
jgi:hypothetical protein